MSTNKNHILYVMILLITAVSIFFAGVSEDKASAKLISTDDELEQRLAARMKEDEEQQRESLTYNPILARIARQKAYDMGKRNYASHVNPDGEGPNYLVTQGGYVLPKTYAQEKSSNNIESISFGKETVEDTWKDLMKSDLHRTHLLGFFGFYTEQIEYGIGHAYVPESLYKHYWVIITAKPGETDKKLTVANSRVP